MKKFLFSVLLFSSFMYSAKAQWSGDPTVGTPVATTSPTTVKTGNVACSDGAGGMFTAWIDSRTAASQSIYIQRILANGTLKFAGEVVVTNSGNVAGGTAVTKSNLAIVSDGGGGAICVWQDARNTTTTPANTNTDIYGQRIDANGNILWTANGVRLTVSDNTVSNKISPAIDLVSATEAIVVFGDNRLGTSDLFAQKILLSAGAPQWGGDVGVHGNLANTQTAQSILNDGAGGAFIVWQDPRVATSNSDIYAQRISNTGTLLWGASGTAVCNAANNQLTPQFVSDNAGGIVCTWSDQRAAAGDGNIYAQRLDGTGAAQWTANGVAVCIFANNQSNPYIVNAGSNFILAWSDQRVAISDRNIFSQSVNSAGALQWTPASSIQTDGIAITQATGNQPSSSVQSGIQLLADGSNGAVVIWDDARISTSNLDVYAQRVNSSGLVQWATDGVPVSTAALNQQGPVAVNSLSGSFIIAWRDARSGTINGEIYAARLQPTGVLPIRSLVISGIVKTNSIDVKWTTVDESNTDFFVIEKSSDGITYASIGSVKAKGFGNGAYLLNDIAPVKGNNYYRIKPVDKNGAVYYSSIALVQYDKAPTASLIVYPNPVLNTASLQLVNFSNGTYHFQIHDLSGRSVMQQIVSVQTDFITVPVSLSRLPAGSYVIQLATSSGVILNKMFQKN